MRTLTFKPGPWAVLATSTHVYTRIKFRGRYTWFTWKEKRFAQFKKQQHEHQE